LQDRLRGTSGGILCAKKQQHKKRSATAEPEALRTTYGTLEREKVDGPGVADRGNDSGPRLAKT